LKIFVSYSRRDAGDFAEQTRRHLTTFNHTVFTDTNSITAGDIWNDVIEDNITNCDIFVVIITHGSLVSSHVEKEVLQAQRDKKRIIPCIHQNVMLRSLFPRMWGLEKTQGIQFLDKYDLSRDLYLKIEKYENKDHKLKS
jgi:TIR domain-containing protein